MAITTHAANGVDVAKYSALAKKPPQLRFDLEADISVLQTLFGTDSHAETLVLTYMRDADAMATFLAGGTTDPATYAVAKVAASCWLCWRTYERMSSRAMRDQISMATVRHIREMQSLAMKE